MRRKESIKKNSKFMNISFVFYILIYFAIFVSLQPALTNAQSDFLKYINEDKFKHYENGLFLGMFNSQKEAEEYLGKLNPVTLIPYDCVFAFGMIGNIPWVKVWEVTRTIGDNLSWSPLTNCSKIDGLKFNYLVCHSNGCDVANNAIKANFIKVENLIALAPPAGFKEEARNLSGVKSVEIYRTKGDPVAEVLGKRTVFGILQKLGDLNIGVINRSDGQIVGLEITRPWPDKIRSPKIKEKLFDEPLFFTNNPHDYNTNVKNVALDKMYFLNRTIETADPNVATKEKMSVIKETLESYRSKFPDAVKKFDQTLSIVPSYWTYGNRPQSLTEAQTLTETVHNKNKAIIVGKGAEADLMYKNMVQKLGESKVKRIDSNIDSTSLQLEARKFGADVILGVKDTKLSEATDPSFGRVSGQKPGGVFMAPQPESSGKGGSEVRDEVLRSKPSGDSLSWPIKEK